MSKRGGKADAVQLPLDPSFLQVSEEEIERLRADILHWLKALKLPSWAGGASTAMLSKDSIRVIHTAQRQEILQRELAALHQKVPDLLEYFADGREVRPEAIDPELVLVKGEGPTADLFRFTTL